MLKRLKIAWVKYLRRTRRINGVEYILRIHKLQNS